MADNIEHITLKITKVLDLAEAAKKVLEEKKKMGYSTTTYGSGYTRGGYSTDYRTIYFYEFSDTSRSPRVFGMVSKFVEWAKSVDILISSTMVETLKTMPTAFCACRNGSATLVARVTKALLDAEINKINNNTNNSSTNSGTVGSTVYSRKEGSYPYDYNNFYNDWD